MASGLEASWSGDISGRDRSPPRATWRRRRRPEACSRRASGWTTYSADSRPPAPGLFSTTTVWPRSLRGLVGHKTRENIVAAAGREADHQADRPARIIALRARRRDRRAEHASAARAGQRQNQQTSFVYSPSLTFVIVSTVPAALASPCGNCASAPASIQPALRSPLAAARSSTGARTPERRRVSLPELPRPSRAPSPAASPRRCRRPEPASGI